MLKTVTVKDLHPNVRRALTFRILAELEANETTTPWNATTSACWKHLQEIIRAGWDFRARCALIASYAIIGAQITADALRDLDDNL